MDTMLAGSPLWAWLQGGALGLLFVLLIVGIVAVLHGLLYGWASVRDAFRPLRHARFDYAATDEGKAASAFRRTGAVTLQIGEQAIDAETGYTVTRYGRNEWYVDPVNICIHF